MYLEMSAFYKPVFGKDRLAESRHTLRPHDNC